jgi:hypothetical protein
MSHSILQSSIGSNSLLKKHVQGRNKMQEKLTPYRVVQRFKDNVYGIQLADGKNDCQSEVLSHAQA